MNKIQIFIVIACLILIVVIFLPFKNNPSTKDTNKSLAALGLKFVKDIPLSGGANRWDYQSINYENNRLYISHLGSSMVTVFDLETEKILKDIPLASSPYGILAVPIFKKVFVGVGGNNQVAVIDEYSLKVITYIQAGDTPDGVAYASNVEKIFISNENSGTVTVIDGKTNEKIEDIPVGGSVGNTQFDSYAKLIYSVSGEDNTLIEIDPTTDKVINKYKVTGCSHPHGFYIDESTRYALITCQVNDKLIVFDLTSKKIVMTDSVGSGADVLAFDPDLHHLYIAAESGVMTIFDIQKDNVKKIGQSFIAVKAHTVSVDRNTHKIYLPLENVNGKPILRILEPS